MSFEVLPDGRVAASMDYMKTIAPNVQLPQQIPAAGGTFAPTLGQGGLFRDAQGAFNWQGMGQLAQGIGALGGLWGSIQQNKLAKQQLDLSREAYNTNMNNTIKSYNTALSDKINARYIMEGRPQEANAYLEQNRLTR